MVLVRLLDSSNLTSTMASTELCSLPCGTGFSAPYVDADGRQPDRYRRPRFSPLTALSRSAFGVVGVVGVACAVGVVGAVGVPCVLLLRRWGWLGFAAAASRFISATTPARFVSAAARMIHRLIVLRSVARTGATLLLTYDFRR
jgi:hypothetical protein